MTVEAGVANRENEVEDLVGEDDCGRTGLGVGREKLHQLSFGRKGSVDMYEM